MRMVRLAVLVFCVVTLARSLRAENSIHEFTQLVLSEEFASEGACIADVDSDGHSDVVSGPFWYAGPEFRHRIAYANPKTFAIAGYSEHFFSFARDFNGDGHVDLLVIPIPGRPAHWFENPGSASVRTNSARWRKHLVLNEVGNESPVLIDLTGDGRDELVCCHGGALGYATPDPVEPTKPWSFVAISDQRTFGAFTHGLGVGDVNMDGRLDVLEARGWWEHPPDAASPFVFHPYPFAQSGGSQMFAYDFDGDGDNDVVSVQNAHAHGLTWFERRGKDRADITFIPHPILTDKWSENAYGLTISQMHSLALVDMDGDGVKDLVTGKRYWAHGGGDPGSRELPVLYWFRTVRTPVGVEFQPHLISDHCGVGTQLTVGDATGDGLDDIVVANKLGTFVLQHEARSIGDAEYAAWLPKKRDSPAHSPGTDLFASHVRTTQPFTPEEEQKSFVLPEGFEIQLVASEPQIAKPMNMAFDARGRLWVTSSSEYPIAASDRPGRDTIKVLEDKDGDGRADVITTFADDLNIPMGLYPYRDGVIVFSIPNILFLRDTDGDGRADTRQKLFGPFDTTRDTHGMCNAFTRGLDGWLYACHGFNNQSSVTGPDGNTVTMHSGNTFRMRVDGSRIEHFTHGQVNPFGMAFDENGDLFSADCHTKPISLLIPGGYHDSFGKPHDGLGYIPNVMDHLHGSTAIGGIAFGSATSFPDVYRNSTFGGNVATCRINRNSLVRIGSSIRAREEPDFLTSGDPWFRPADLQVAPDGSLYLTDFYNGIIGHYEVPLDDPRRDRTRGRIWRIVYKGGETRRDDNRPTSNRAVRDIANATVEQLIAELDSPLQARTDLVVERLVDQFGATCVASVRPAMTNGSPRQRSHCAWVLHRLGQLTPAELAALCTDDSTLVRVHAYRILGATAGPLSNSDELLEKGLADNEPIVRRVAATAVGRHPSERLVQALLNVFENAPTADVHLRHAIRMSLRDLLRNEAWFNELTAKTPRPSEAELIGSLCLSLKTAAAGEYVAHNLDALAGAEPDRIAQYMEFAVQHVSGKTVAQLAETAQQRFADDHDYQLQLLGAVRTGLERRNSTTPEAVRSWATSLASRFLSGSRGEAAPLSWTQIPQRSGEGVWRISRRRSSADGMQSTPLWSSFLAGEQATGTYRSSAFELPDSFSFYLAGHDGFPDKPLQNRNFVQVRDAATHAVIKRWSSRRNDTAQPIVWQTGDSAGRRAYVELVDGDTAGAYAWLAVGRFSVAGLNPSRTADDRRNGAALVADFRLEDLRGTVTSLATAPGVDPTSLQAYAGALAATHDVTAPNSPSASLLQALADATPLIPSSQRTKLIDTLISPTNPATVNLLEAAMRQATSDEQLKIAEVLASDSRGSSLLLVMASEGKISARTLTRPSVEQRLLASLSDDEKQLFSEVTSRLPDENAELKKLITARQQSYISSVGSRDIGAKLFGKNCATCHQVAGQGKKVGPNLDGIGGRGLARLLEDVLAPNRNVDVAFRATTVVTVNGKLITGLARPIVDGQLTIIDSNGKEISIPEKSIDERIQSRLSPMPANFGESMKDDEFRHLLSYLLSLR